MEQKKNEKKIEVVDQEIIIDHTVNPITIDGYPVLYDRSWKEDDKDYTVYITADGNVWIEEDNAIYQWTYPEERTQEERDQTMKQLMEFFDGND